MRWLDSAQLAKHCIAMAESSPPLVLVTGASGFVSTWLIKELLEKGEYRVRGTVRDKSKEEKVK